MRKRPLSITVTGWLFLAAGAIGLAYHAAEFDVTRPFEHGLVLVMRLLAVLCGVFLLRGANWARWLLLAWIAYHVLLSALHTPFELVAHGVLFALVAYFLLRPKVSAYFHGARAGAPQTGREPRCSR